MIENDQNTNVVLYSNKRRSNKQALYYTEVFRLSISASNKSSMDSDIVKEGYGNLRKGYLMLE